jgi:hypothetical protein
MLASVQGRFTLVGTYLPVTVGGFWGEAILMIELPKRHASPRDLSQLPVSQTFDNMTRSRADTVSTCGNGPSLWRPRAVRQSLPHSSLDMRVGASTQPQGTLDEGTFRHRYGEAVHHRTQTASDHAKTVGGIWSTD